jgi:hypothetical protein
VRALRIAIRIPEIVRKTRKRPNIVGVGRRRARVDFEVREPDAQDLIDMINRWADRT